MALYRTKDAGRPSEVLENEHPVWKLDPMPGYRLERDGSGLCLVDPEGRPVARVSEGVGGPDEEWGEIYQALLLLARGYAIECEVLRERVEELGEKLEESEKERGRLEALSEDLYGFFSRKARRVAQRNRGEEWPGW